MKRSSFVLLVAVVCAACIVACSKDDPAQLPTPPTVSGVSASVVSPGDTIVVTGGNFDSPASSNTVTFTNPLGKATPIAGSSTSLTVVVDQDATSGPVTVSNDGGTASGPSLEVNRGVGDFFVFGGTGAARELALPNPTATTQYLVVPHATNPKLPYSKKFTYGIHSESDVPVAASGVAVPQSNASGNSGTSLQTTFEAWRWEQARELGARVGTPQRRVVTSACAAADSIRQFSVLNTTTGRVDSPSSYAHIDAQLRYTGTRCVIYADVDTLASGNFSMDDLRTIGEAFDNSIEATNVSYFGAYSDIDSNCKVIILITPVVNRLTPPGSTGFIAGFFLFIDLYSPPSVPSTITNQGEIFYLLAADPGANWGNTFDVAFTRDENVSTTAHEHEHMISFSRRIFHEGGSLQQTWLEEGMAHMAEDLNGMHDANEKRATRYLDDPGSTSLEDNSASLEQRGGIYLFLRLMADRYGTGMFKEIVQSRCSGRACIEGVTGEDFYDLLAEFFAALYLSGKGITADPRFNYTSIDLGDYGSLATSLRVAGSDASGTLFRSSGDCYLYSGVLNAQSRFVFSDSTGGARLRQAVVRVQ